MYIAIAGNIGSGKTSLTEILAKRFDARIYEEDTSNPYLNDFYGDMNRWAFNLQVYFLGSRIEQARMMLDEYGDLIQDRTIYEDAYIFATNLHEMGLMSSRDYESYMRIFEISRRIIATPDLLIYLKASVPTLISQIQKRGRAYEMSIQQDYLLRLNEKYENWINNIYEGEVITLDIDKDDFVMDPSVLEPIVERISRIKSIKG